MPRLVRKPPAYQHHKATGQARVKTGGRDHWLGPYGSEASHREYERIISEWRATRRQDALAQQARSIPGRESDCTITELILAYWEHAKGDYVKDGAPTGELQNIRYALAPLREVYGHTP